MGPISQQSLFLLYPNVDLPPPNLPLHLELLQGHQSWPLLEPLQLALLHPLLDSLVGNLTSWTFADEAPDDRVAGPVQLCQQGQG